MKKHKRKPKTHPDTYFILVGFSVVMFWRGAWGLMDLYLFPNNPTLSFLPPYWPASPFSFSSTAKNSATLVDSVG